MIPCSYWASVCLAVLPSCMTSYVVSVRQVGGLPVVSLFPHPASFRSHLAVGTLAFGCILPTTGRIRDFHPLETCAARRTKSKEHPVSGMPFPLLYSVFVRFNRKCGFTFSQSHAFPELCIYQAVAISSAIPVDFTNAPVSQTIPVPRLVSTMLPLGYTERSAAHMI